MSERLLTELRRALADCRPPDRLLVAVSGGADSVALLALLVEAVSRRPFLDTSLTVAHVRHDLRPASDTALDQALVRKLAESFGLPMLCRDVEVGRRGGIEAAARRVRYAALEEMAREAGCGAVVTAHTATDQAETVLWRLARGAGARGLGAMRPARKLGTVRLLRPLLGVTREELRAFCARRGLAFRDDPTNREPRPRVRVRDEVLPVLEAMAPGATLRIARTADRLRADDDLLGRLARRKVPDPADVEALRRAAAPLRGRALVEWWRARTGSRRRLEAVHRAALERLVHTGRGEVELPASRRARRVAVVRNGLLMLEERPRTNPAGRPERPTFEPGTDPREGAE